MYVHYFKIILICCMALQSSINIILSRCWILCTKYKTRFGYMKLLMSSTSTSCSWHAYQNTTCWQRTDRWVPFLQNLHSVRTAGIIAGTFLLCFLSSHFASWSSLYLFICGFDPLREKNRISVNHWWTKTVESYGFKTAQLLCKYLHQLKLSLYDRE